MYIRENAEEGEEEECREIFLALRKGSRCQRDVKLSGYNRFVFTYFH